jgi:P27 family predicted phage terminase small subunit
MPGPTKTPTNLRLLRGNPGKEAMPKGEPQPLRYDRVPEPPQRLKDEAREEWLRIAPEMHRLGLLTVADLRPLACYCLAYGRWCDAEDAMIAAKANDPHHNGLVVVTDKGGLASNPLVKIASQAAHDLMRYAAEFGFTPASRTRISGNAAASEPEPKFGGLLANQ